MKKSERRRFRVSIIHSIATEGMSGMAVKRRDMTIDDATKKATRIAINLIHAGVEGYCNSYNAVSEPFTRDDTKVYLRDLIDRDIVEKKIIEWDDKKTVVVKYQIK